MINCERKKYLNIPVISPGKLLRHEIEIKSKLGKLVKKRLAKGQLVSGDIVEKILDKRFSNKDIEKGFILDGYPRRLKQAFLLKNRMEKLLSTEDRMLVIDIEIKDKVIKKELPAEGFAIVALLTT